MKTDYFRIIDTEDKAYWLGFLYADGCITTDKKYIILELSSEDLEHIEKFKDDIQAHQKIRIYKRNNIEYARLCIGCKEMVSDLIKVGCIPHKTFNIVFPETNIIPKDLIHHFIRGIFDGDGCISITNREKRNRIYNIYTLSFLGTKNLLNGINHELPVDNMNIVERGNIFCMKTQCKQKILDILNYLYNNCNTYLTRKYIKYNQLKCI